MKRCRPRKASQNFGYGMGLKATDLEDHAATVAAAV